MSANDPAFPGLVTEIHGDITRQYMAGGLTKREYFAGLAMQGMLASDYRGFKGDIIQLSVSHADELINALEAP